jgi:hypothetical protein
LKFYYKLLIGVVIFIYFEFKKIKKIYNYIKYFLDTFDFLKLLRFKFKINEHSFKNKYLRKFLILNKKKNKNNIEKFHVKKKYILIESLINHPIYTLSSSIIANTLSKNYTLIGLIRFGDIRSKEIMKSYGVKKFITINNSNFFLRLFHFYESIIILSKLKNFDDLINLKIDRLEIGKSVYEHYTRFVGNYPKKVDWKIILFFSESLFYQKKSRRILNKFKPSYLIQSEQMFIPHRILFQQALKSKTKIICKSHVNNACVKLYKNFSEKNINRLKISKKLFSLLNKKNHKSILSKANNIYFSKKENKQIGKESDVINNRKIQKKIEKSFKLREAHVKENFLKYLDLSSSKKTVLILSHELTDGTFANSWNIFKNDQIWLEETLKIIKKIKNINFIIKPHPSESFYKSKISTEKIFRENISKKNSHIKLFSIEQDINSIFRYIDVVISSHGSAGYQYPAYSIPAIICGDTPFSDLGFNIQPKNFSEYKKTLFKLNRINKLDVKIANKAKAFWFVYKNITRVKMPTIHFEDISMNYNAINFWRKTYENLKNSQNFKIKNDFENFLKLQIKKNNSNMLNHNLLKNLKDLKF